ncbi:hypothetical protein BLOT_001132 [Blomia tropicalis]|nr:hypothetical protein BLOT_001132 [Blomia tropicalis]
MIDINQTHCARQGTNPNDTKMLRSSMMMMISGDARMYSNQTTHKKKKLWNELSIVDEYMNFLRIWYDRVASK